MPKLWPEILHNPATAACDWELGSKLGARTDQDKGSTMKGKKIPSGESFSVRLPPELLQVASDLGGGSIAEGIRRALRSCSKNAPPAPLSQQLRGAALLAAELERRQRRTL